MTSSQPSKAQANLQLAIWNKQAESSTSEELYVRIQKLGLPEEVTARLHDLVLGSPISYRLENNQTTLETLRQ